MDKKTNVTRGFRNNGNGGMISPRGTIISWIMMGLWLICSGVLIPGPAWSLDTAEREALIASLPKGEVFENDGSTYACLPTLRAERTGIRQTESGLNVTGSAAPGEVVEQKGLFTVYKASRELQRTSGEVSAHPVVLNLETRSIGIITGRLWLKLKDLSDAGTMADAYGMTLSFVNDPMSTAFYDVPAGVDILTLRKELEADPRVLRVTLDMVDRIRQPK